MKPASHAAALLLLAALPSEATAQETDGAGAAAIDYESYMASARVQHNPPGELPDLNFGDLPRLDGAKLAEGASWLAAPAEIRDARGQALAYRWSPDKRLAASELRATLESRYGSPSEQDAAGDRLVWIGAEMTLTATRRGERWQVLLRRN